MALDFSQIKAITIPQGTVKKIEDSNGNVLWQEPVQPTWHELWSGSKSLTYSSSSSSVPSNVSITTLSGLTNPANLRVTFSITASSPSGNTNYEVRYTSWKGSWTTSKPSSPISKSDFNPTSTNYNMLGTSVYYKYGGGFTVKCVYLKYDNGSIFLKASNDGNVSSGTWSLKITVTKIEQYY